MRDIGIRLLYNKKQKNWEEATNMSRILTRIMLSLFALLLLYELSVCAFLGRSYAVALFLALLLTAAYIFLVRRRRGESVWRRMGALKSWALLTAVFLAVNLPVFFLVSVTPDNDFATFWKVALALAGGSELAEGTKVYVALFPHILGYSTFLSGLLRLFGESALVPVIVNLILTMFSGMLIFKLVLRWLDVDAASFAYLLWSLCPSKMLYNTMVLSEPLYTFLLLLFILLLSELESRSGSVQRPLLWGAAAGALGGVILRAVNVSRPVAAIPIIAFFIWVLLLRGAELREKKKWLLYLSFATLMLAVYLPLGSLWNGYAARVADQEPAGVPGYSLYVGFNPESRGQYSTEDSLLLESFCASEGSAAQAQQRMLEALKQRLASGDINFIRLFSAKLKSFLGFDEGGAFYMSGEISPLEYSALAVVSNVFYYCLLLLALLGAVRAFRRQDRSCVLLVPMYVLGLTAAHMLVEVSPRYHYSVIPMLVIMAAFSRESGIMKKASLAEAEK